MTTARSARKKKMMAPEGMAEDRYAELKRMLEERRQEIWNAVKERMRDVRTDAFGSASHAAIDPGETSEADVQEDIELALIQMKSETLARIDEALQRLEDGTYGNCFECGREIAPPRLRALPFAIRCRECEEVRENAQQRDRVARRGSSSLFLDTSRDIR